MTAKDTLAENEALGPIMGAPAEVADQESTSGAVKPETPDVQTPQEQIDELREGLLARIEEQDKEIALLKSNNTKPPLGEPSKHGLEIVKIKNSSLYGIQRLGGGPVPAIIGNAMFTKPSMAAAVIKDYESGQLETRMKADKVKQDKIAKNQADAAQVVTERAAWESERERQRESEWVAHQSAQAS